MNLSQISIITPTFNSEDYIEDCIQSVLSQNYPNFEHIIIDGGSSDGTIEILKKYPHLKWISEPDKGQSHAINKGLKMAKGELIGWCNSDDVYIQGTFEKVVAIFRDQKLHGVYSNLYFADQDLNITRKLVSHAPVKWLSLFHCYVPSATLFLNRILIDNGINLDESKHITMDKELVANILFSNYTLKYVDDYYAIFRWHGNNKSLNTKTTLFTRLKEGVAIFNKYSSIKLPENEFGYFVYKNINPFVILIKYLNKIKLKKGKNV